GRSRRWRRRRRPRPRPGDTRREPARRRQRLSRGQASRPVPSRGPHALSLLEVLTPCPPLPSGEGGLWSDIVSPLPEGEGIKGVRTSQLRIRRAMLNRSSGPLRRIYRSGRAPGYGARAPGMLPRSRKGRPKTAISRSMGDQPLAWARVWYALKREEDEGLLRQGAWYPIVSSGVTRAVLEVSGQRVTVPQEALEVRDKRPDKFTVVYRTREDPNPARGTRADAGRRYGVCPRCATRLPFRNNVIPAVASCQQCG